MVKKAKIESKPKLESKPKTESGKGRVLIVDDHPAVYEGLAVIINQTDDLEVCGHADSGAKAMASIAALKPDALVVDLSLKSSNGLELVKDVRSRYSGKLPMLVLSMHDEALYAERVLQAGALGYVMKQEPTDAVIQGLRKILRGGVYLSEAMTTRLMGSFVNHHHDPAARSLMELLSDRELEVFELLGGGLGTREIADQLHLSMKTVSCYRQNIKRKLNVKTATELVRHAVHWASTPQPAQV